MCETYRPAFVWKASAGCASSRPARSTAVAVLATLCQPHGCGGRVRVGRVGAAASARGMCAEVFPPGRQHTHTHTHRWSAAVCNLQVLGAGVRVLHSPSGKPKNSRVTSRRLDDPTALDHMSSRGGSDGTSGHVVSLTPRVSDATRSGPGRPAPRQRPWHAGMGVGRGPGCHARRKEWKHPQTASAQTPLYSSPAMSVVQTLSPDPCTVVGLARKSWRFGSCCSRGARWVPGVQGGPWVARWLHAFTLPAIQIKP